MTDQTAATAAATTADTAATTADIASGGRPASPADMSVDSVPAEGKPSAVVVGEAAKVPEEADDDSSSAGSGSHFSDDDHDDGDDNNSDYDASATFDSGSVENDDEYSYEYIPSDEEGRPRRRFGEESDSDSEDDEDEDDSGDGGGASGKVVITGGKEEVDEEEKKADDIVPLGTSLKKADSTESEDVSPRDAKRPALEHPRTSGGGLATPPASVPVSPDRARRLQQLQQRQDKQMQAGLLPRALNDRDDHNQHGVSTQTAAGLAGVRASQEAYAAARASGATSEEAREAARAARLAAMAAEDGAVAARAARDASEAALAAGATAEEANAAAKAASAAADRARDAARRPPPPQPQPAPAAAAGAAAGAAGATTTAAPAAPPRPPPTPCPNPNCPHEAHAPISCDQMATWNDTCRAKTSGILTVPSPSVQYCMEHMIESISEMLDIPPAGVAVLLRENGWDIQTLMTGNAAALIRRSGVSYRCRDAANRHDNNNNNNNNATGGGGGAVGGGGAGGGGGTGGAPGSPFRGGAGHLLEMERRVAAATAGVFRASASTTTSAASATGGTGGARARPFAFGGRPDRGGGGWRMAAAADDDEMMAQAIEASLQSEEDRKARRALEAKRRHGVEMRIGQTAPEFAPHLDPVGGATATSAAGGGGGAANTGAARSSAAASSTTTATGTRATNSAALARNRASLQRVMEQLQRSESEDDSFFMSSDGDSLGDDELLPGNAFHAAAASRSSTIDTNSGPAASGSRTMFSRIFSSRAAQSSSATSGGGGGGASSSSKSGPELKKQASQERRKAFEDARAAAAAAAARAAAQEEEAKKKAASASASEGEDSDAKVDNNNGDGTSDEDMDGGKATSDDDDDGDGDGKKTATKEAGDKEKEEGLLTCEICFNDELTEADILPFPCQHKYCRDCWKGLITSMLQSTGEDGGGGGNVDTILSTTCPSVGCSECITEVEVKELCPDLLPAFRRLQLHSFVAGRGMESLRWCPGPDCDRVAVRCRRDLFDCVDREIPTGSCGSCTTSFCFQCGEEPHPQGQTCSNPNATGDDDLFGGMGGKSGPPIKHCPKCKVKIEKNGGCNHMRCKCGHHFCWICLGDYRGRHFCGREGGRQNTTAGAAAANAGNNAAGGGAAGNAAAQGAASTRTIPNFDLDYLHTTLGNSKAPDNDADRNALATFLKDKEAMDHFAHYYNRFAAHNQGQEYAETQTHCTENRVNEYGKTTDIKTATDSNFIADANKTLVDCRRVLKYSYAYSYCNDDDAHKELFLVHVERLERFVEDLSLESESAVTAAGREKVINLINIVEKSKEAVEGYIDFGATFTARGGKMM